jgi:hypothetical protein
LESGLFNGLRRIQIKKSPPFSASRGGCDELGFQTAYDFPRPVAAGASILPTGTRMKLISDFVKDISRPS